MNKWDVVKLIGAALGILTILFTASKEVNRYLDNQGDLARLFTEHAIKADKRIEGLERSVMDNQINIKYIQKNLEVCHEN